MIKLIDPKNFRVVDLRTTEISEGSKFGGSSFCWYGHQNLKILYARAIPLKLWSAPKMTKKNQQKSRFFENFSPPPCVFLVKSFKYHLLIQY